MEKRVSYEALFLSARGRKHMDFVLSIAAMWASVRNEVYAIRRVERVGTGFRALLKSGIDEKNGFYN